MKEPKKPKWYQFWLIRNYRISLVEYRKDKLTQAFQDPHIMESVKDLTNSIEVLRSVYNLNDGTYSIRDNGVEKITEKD